MVAPVGTAATIFVALQLVGVAAVPLKLTVLVPCVAPKFVPLMVTDVPTWADIGDSPVMAGVELALTVKLTPLLAWPPTVTTTFPVVAAAGTSATMALAVQLVGVAAAPLNLTVLPPCVEPKFIPVIVTEVPAVPDVGDTLVMLGAGTVTVKLTPLLAWAPTVTITFPVVAPIGTGTTMLVALQLVGIAAVPLKLTALVPCVLPKLVPLIVTGVPTGPEVGDRPVIAGIGLVVTAKLAALLARPATVAITLPVVAPAGTGATMLVPLQLVGVATVPLKLTVLVPCIAPKFAPVIVTEVPTRPDVGDRLAILGA